MIHTRVTERYSQLLILLLKKENYGIQENIILGVSEYPALAAASVTALTAEYILKQKINLSHMSTLGLIVEAPEFLSELSKRSIVVEIFEGDKKNLDTN